MSNKGGSSRLSRATGRTGSRSGAKALTAIALLALLMFEVAYAGPYYALGLRSVVTSLAPNVALQTGNRANSTIFTNSTSAGVTTPTLNYPTGYNVVTGTYTSGAVPGSVNADDSNYFITASTTSGTTDSAFKDGASVAVPTTLGLIDSIATSLPSGNNLVVAIVQIDNTGGSTRTINAGNLQLRRGTLTSDPLLSQSQFTFHAQVSGTEGDGSFAVLLGSDVGAPSNPTYGVFGAASGTGLNAEVKFLVIGGLASADSVYADGGSVSLGTSATTLISQATTFPASSASLPNIIVAAIQHDGVNDAVQIPAGGTRIQRSTTTLANNQYGWRVPKDSPSDGSYEFLVAIDSSAPANPTYVVDSRTGLSASASNAEAKVLIFRGLSASFVDTGSVSIGTSRTVIGSSSTSFAAGDDVLFGVIQLEGVGAVLTVAAAANDIRRTGDSASSNNQFSQTLKEGSTNDNSGPFQGFVRKVTTTAANPSYEGAATEPSGSNLNAELKLVAIHVRDAAAATAESEFTLSVSSDSPIQLNFTVIQQYSIASVTVRIQVYNYTGASYPISGQGYLTYTSSTTAGVEETKSLNITTNPSQYVSGGAAKVKVTGTVTSIGFDQNVDLVRLYFYQQTYDYVLKIVNQQPTSYNIRLNAAGLTHSNLGRLSNFTAWLHDGGSSTQLQVLSGSLSTPTGTYYTLDPSATVYLAIRVTATSAGVSTIDSYLQIFQPSTTAHVDYRLTFSLT